MVSAVVKKVDETFDVNTEFDLDRAVQQAESKLQWHQSEMAKLQAFVGALKPMNRPKVAQVPSFKDWTIPQCAKQILLEEGAPMTTRQILNKMLERGWETRSERAITVVHSGLAETPYVQRVGKRWDLTEKGLKTNF